MRVRVAKTGMEVVDKLTGIAYRIDATDGATNTEITKAEATEILDEDDEREPRKATITQNNDLTFRVTKWVEDTELHSANIVNGILQVDGQDIVMGSVVAKKILKVFPGTVVFTAAGDEDSDRDVVREYTPSRDKMVVLGSMEPASVVINDSDTRTIYGFSLTKEIEVKDGDQVKKETVFDRAGLYVLTKGHFDYEDLAESTSNSYYEDEYDDEDDEYGDEYDNEYEESADEIEGFLGFDFTIAVMAQGDKYLYIPRVDAEKETTYKVYRVTNKATYNGSIEMPGKLTNVTANRTSARNLGKAIFSGEGFKKVDDVVIRSNELKDYIYLVDATYDRESRTNTYVFASEERNVKKVTRKMTQDRGEIVTIE